MTLNKFKSIIYKLVPQITSMRYKKEITMEKIETVQDFKRFLNNNRDKLLERTIRVEELPPEDEWIQDDEWDEIYKQEEIRNGKI